MPETENVTTKFKVDISDLKKNIADANKTIQTANAEFKNATAGMDKWSDSADGLSAKIQQQEKIIDAETKKLDALKQQLDRLNKSQENGEKIISDLTKQHADAAAQFGKNSDEAKKLAKQLKDAQTAQQRNADAAEKLKIQIINQDTAVKNATAQAKKYETQLDELTHSTDYLKQRQQDLTTELKQAVTQYGRNSAEAKALKSELQNVSKELKNAENAAEDADSAAENLENGFTVAKGAIANFIADGINALLSKLGEAIQYLGTFGQEFDTTMNGFQASTGASAAEMQEFEDTAKRIYNANFGESWEDIAAAMATVKQQAGDIGADELENMTKNALMLRDTFDFDVNESMRAVNMLMNQFGISSDEAFNLLAQGAQEGLDKNGDLLDTINEYSVHYKQQGYSAEEFFNSLKNGTEAGTFSVDKLGDAMKEFGIRAKDNSDSTRDAFSGLMLDADEMTKKFAAGGDESREAMQQVTDALFGMKNEVKQNEIGVALFGTMWEDLGADGVKALLDVNGEISNTTDALGEIDKVKYSSVGDALQGIKRNLETGILMPISDRVLPKVQELADKFADWLNNPETQAKISELADKFADFAENGIDKVVAAFEWIIDHKDGIIAAITGIAAGFVAFKIVTMVQSAVTAFQALAAVIQLVGAKQAITNAIMAANPIGLIIAAIAALVAAFVYLWNNCDEFREFWINLWETIKTYAGAAWEAISGFFAAAWEYIKAIWAEVQPYFSMIWENIKLVFSVVADVLGGYFKMAWDNIKIIWDLVVGYFKMIWENIKLVFSVVKSVLSGDFKGAWEAIKKIWDNVKGYFLQVWNGVKGIFGNVGEFFRGKFSDAWEKIKSVFSKVGSFFGGIWDTIKEKFSSIGTKIGNAIGGAFKLAINAVLATVERGINFVPNAINKALDLINALPGVNIPHMPTISLPRLARGGIVDKATLAEIGEDGAEAVLPLEKNKQGLKKIAQLLAGEMDGGNNGGNNGGKGGGDTIYNFNQTNNSPKALSRYEIYRQTKNLINAVKVQGG